MPYGQEKDTCKIFKHGIIPQVEKKIAWMFIQAIFERKLLSKDYS
ncbi:hypothetical protein PEPS_46310 (plasmid) [Persicobacter psychrovividus]|uniref:Uncharacterized protein n=1 Tax=Persicobacter psychrovividus TaxID=387638 RepID=A0ABM7VMX5_9BACT|nr:hypothetical protein PEPS_46310 [Persicobacter psychrovividus]